MDGRPRVEDSASAPRSPVGRPPRERSVADFAFNRRLGVGTSTTSPAGESGGSGVRRPVAGHRAAVDVREPTPVGSEMSPIGVGGESRAGAWFELRPRHRTIVSLADAALPERRTGKAAGPTTTSGSSFVVLVPLGRASGGRPVPGSYRDSRLGALATEYSPRVARSGRRRGRVAVVLRRCWWTALSADRIRERAGATFERGQLVERPDGSGGDQQVA